MCVRVDSFTPLCFVHPKNTFKTTLQTNQKSSTSLSRPSLSLCACARMRGYCHQRGIYQIPPMSYQTYFWFSVEGWTERSPDFYPSPPASDCISKNNISPRAGKSPFNRPSLGLQTGSKYSSASETACLQKNELCPRWKRLEASSKFWQQWRDLQLEKWKHCAAHKAGWRREPAKWLEGQLVIRLLHARRRNWLPLCDWG